MTPQSGSHQAPEADSGSTRWRPSGPDAVARWRSVVAWMSLVVFGVIAVVMPAQVDGRWGLGDRLMFFGLGVADRPHRLALRLDRRGAEPRRASSCATSC